MGVLQEHWQSVGYAVPNAATYPHQWLWDSCFHAVVWAAAGRGAEAVAELRCALAHQGPDGFVPHMTYWSDPEAATGFWGRRLTSCLTQPPMYGHALAALDRYGVAVPDDLIDAAHRGLAHLLGARRHGGAGGVRIVHPWESGCDDSPRWDGWCPTSWSPSAWRVTKGSLVVALAALVDVGGTAMDGVEPVGDPVPATLDAEQVRQLPFAVEPAGFNALVAFNARELASLGRRPTADAMLMAAADELAGVLARRWDPKALTWVDVDPSGATTSAVRTLDALLGALVVNDSEQCAAAVAQFTDAASFGAPFGPRGVHPHEPSCDPDTYWRGPAWPQLGYLAWLAARRCGADAVADGVGAALVAGAHQSGWAEYWNPETGSGGGAAPQSWTGVAAVVAGGA